MRKTMRSRQLAGCVPSFVCSLRRSIPHAAAAAAPTHSCTAGLCTTTASAAANQCTRASSSNAIPMQACPMQCAFHFTLMSQKCVECVTVLIACIQTRAHTRCVHHLTSSSCCCTAPCNQQQATAEPLMCMHSDACARLQQACRHPLCQATLKAVQCNAHARNELQCMRHNRKSRDADASPASMAHRHHTHMLRRIKRTHMLRIME